MIFFTLYKKEVAMWDSLTLANGEFSTLKSGLGVKTQTAPKFTSYNKKCETAAARYLLS